MNEKPKSIWKKSWKGPGALVAGSLVLACATFVVIFALGLLSAKNNSIKELLAFALIVSLSVWAALVLSFGFFRWLCCWRNLRRALFGFVCLATLIALFYAEENWRGKHAWEKYKQEQQGKGERFDLASIAPPPVPDDQNFAMTPIWVEHVAATMGSKKAKTWYGDKVAALGHTNFVRPLEMRTEIDRLGLVFTNSNGEWKNAEKLDLKLWQEYYRKLAVITNFFPIASRPQTPAEDVLLGLSIYDSKIENLRSAAQLPFSRFPLGYHNDNPAMILLPHLGSFRQVSTALQLRALAELESSQSDKALDDIKLILRLLESIRNEPILISHLVRIANFQIGIQPIWQGLVELRWNDAQLTALAAEFSKLDFLADYHFSMRGEQTMRLGVIDYMRRTRDFEILGMAENTEHWESGSVLPTIIFRLSPSGWFEQNKISISRMNSEYMLPIVDLKKRLISLSTVSNAKEVLAKIPSTPFAWFDRLILPAIEKIPFKYAHAQSSTDMARIAIALERYRLVHGEFPENLDAISPQFLQRIPHDIINGQPLKYRRLPNGQFILYSIGWNGKDDGGTVALENGKTPSVDATKGDWVWKYPAK